MSAYLDQPLRTLAEYEAEVAEYVTHNCHMCGGELRLLGTLGRLAHYRCRDCGLQTSKVAP